MQSVTGSERTVSVNIDKIDIHTIILMQKNMHHKRTANLSRSLSQVLSAQKFWKSGDLQFQ
jgi:hypothetical protein